MEIKTLKDKEIWHKGYFISEDVEKAVSDFNIFIKTLQIENSIFGLNDYDRNEMMRIMSKYDIESVNRDISTYEHILYIHNKIFGDWK